jgi:hypothetical protein
MADKRQLGILAAVVLFAITLGAAFFVVRSYLWSSGSEDLPATASNGGPSAAANAATGPQIQVGILLSDFSATGPHRQATQYGYQTQLRAVRYLRDPSIHLVPVIEPNTGKKGQLPRILAQNFAGETPLIATNPDDMRKLDVLSATAAANLREDVIKAISQRVREGMGFLQRQPGYIVPGYNAETNDLCGFADGVFGFSLNPVECEIVGNHPLLGDLSGQTNKTITLIPNGTVGQLKGIPLLRVKQMKQVMLVAADHTVSTGEYLYPLYISQLGKGRIVGVGFTQGKDVPEALDAANQGRFYIHCVEWLAGKPLN